MGNSIHVCEECPGTKVFDLDEEGVCMCEACDDERIDRHRDYYLRMGNRQAAYKILQLLKESGCHHAIEVLEYAGYECQ